MNSIWTIFAVFGLITWEQWLWAFGVVCGLAAIVVVIKIILLHRQIERMVEKDPNRLVSVLQEETENGTKEERNERI